MWPEKFPGQMINTAVLQSIFKENASHLFVINKVNWGLELIQCFTWVLHFHWETCNLYLFKLYSSFQEFNFCFRIQSVQHPHSHSQSLEWFNWGQCPDGWTKNYSWQLGSGRWRWLLSSPCSRSTMLPIQVN